MENGSSSKVQYTAPQERRFVPRRADWISRIYPPGYTPPPSIDSIKAFNPPNIDEIIQASEIALTWPTASSGPADVSPDDMYTLAFYSFDFGVPQLNERSPQLILNKVLAARMTLGLLSLRGFLYNVLTALRKLPRIDAPSRPGLRLYAPVRADGVFGGFSLKTLFPGGGVPAGPKQQARCSTCGSGIVAEPMGSFEEVCPDCMSEIQVAEERMLTGCVFVTPAFGTAYLGEEAALDVLQKPEPFYSNMHGPEFAGTLITIVGPDTWCYDIEPYSIFPVRGRVIIEPDRVFKVLAVTFENKLRRITLEMIDTPVLLADLIPPKIPVRKGAPSDPPQKMPSSSQPPASSSAATNPTIAKNEPAMPPPLPPPSRSPHPVRSSGPQIFDDNSRVDLEAKKPKLNPEKEEEEKEEEDILKEENEAEEEEEDEEDEGEEEKVTEIDFGVGNEGVRKEEEEEDVEEVREREGEEGDNVERSGETGYAGENGECEDNVAQKESVTESGKNEKKEIMDLLNLIVEKKSMARGIVINVCKELYSKVSDIRNDKQNQTFFVQANGVQGLLETFKRITPFDRDIFINMCLIFRYVIQEKSKK